MVARYCDAKDRSYYVCTLVFGSVVGIIRFFSFQTPSVFWGRGFEKKKILGKKKHKFKRLINLED